MSYTHDSATQKARVLELANRLREEGIDCEIDQFEDSPPEGWPTWMWSQIQRAQYVLVVCTPIYQRRATKQEEPGVGLGATWEGAVITNELYSSGGRNDKFIPLVLQPEAIGSVPYFLQGATRYDLSRPEGYDALYRRLTAQPAQPRRSLGKLRQLGPQEEAPRSASSADPSPAPIRAKPSGGETPSTLGMIVERSGGAHFLSVESIEVGNELTKVVLRPEDGAERVFLEQLSRAGTRSIDFVFRLTCVRARLRDVVHSIVDAGERFTLTLERSELPDGSLMEVGVNGLSADEVATLRARRILLDERLPAVAPGIQRAADSMLEGIVSAFGGDVRIAKSPIPELYRQTDGRSSDYFLAAAKLTATYLLLVSGTVAHVAELDLTLRGDSVAVHFKGVRRRVYTNKAASEIIIDGTCAL